MESEISEIPHVFQKILDHSEIFSKAASLLGTKDIQSVLILARGTSDNAAHFLKYLLEVSKITKKQYYGSTQLFFTFESKKIHLTID